MPNWPFSKYPHHMYHATKPPLTVVGANEEELARKAGYGDMYVPHSFPKHMHCDGKPSVIANNAADEQQALKSGYSVDPV